MMGPIMDNVTCRAEVRAVEEGDVALRGRYKKPVEIDDLDVRRHVGVSIPAKVAQAPPSPPKRQTTFLDGQKSQLAERVE